MNTGPRPCGSQEPVLRCYRRLMLACSGPWELASRPDQHRPKHGVSQSWTSRPRLTTPRMQGGARSLSPSREASVEHVNSPSAARVAPCKHPIPLLLSLNARELGLYQRGPPAADGGPALFTTPRTLPQMASPALIPHRPRTGGRRTEQGTRHLPSRPEEGPGSYLAGRRLWRGAAPHTFRGKSSSPGRRGHQASGGRTDPG